jgi:hypothetical protein
MIKEQATYAEILLSEFPDAIWSGSGYHYADIHWTTPPISHDLLESLVVKVARKREIRKATKRIRKGADKHMQAVGFSSAAVGRLVHYSGDNEAFDYLTAQAVTSLTDTGTTFMCVTDEGLTPHTAEQVRYAHVDAVKTRAAIYLSMMQQIAGLPLLTYVDITKANYAV